MGTTLIPLGSNNSDGFNTLNTNVLKSESTSHSLYIRENEDYYSEYKFDENPLTNLPQPTASGLWYITVEYSGYFITNKEYDKILKLN